MATNETVHVFEYRGGNVPGFGPFKLGDRVSIPLTHPLHRRCIAKGFGTWKEVGRLTSATKAKAVEARAAVGVPTLAMVMQAGYPRGVAEHIVKVRTRMAELVAAGETLRDAERQAEAEIGALPERLDIQRPAPDAPDPTDGDDDDARDDDDDDDDDGDDDSDSGGADDDDGSPADAPDAPDDVAARLAGAMKKAALVRLAKGVGATFKASQRELAIARAIVAKLGGDDAATKNPTVAAALAGAEK